MSVVFITGCPGAGKSTLGRKLAEKTGATQIYIDGLKKVMRKDKKLRPWVLFFSRKNEEEYWKTTSDKEHWMNMVGQSEAFWPRVSRVINSFMKKHDKLIVDGANMMPHLVAQDFPDMKGVVLLPPSRKELFIRLQQEPRWSRVNKRMQAIESKRYWQEAKSYAKEAKQLGYPVFYDADEAFAYLAPILHG